MTRTPVRPDTGRPQPSWVYRGVVTVLRPVVFLLTRHRWSGQENLPRGPFIAVVNHLSVFDPLTVLHYCVDNGVHPRVLAKASLWGVPVLGWVLRRMGAIPVHRDSSDAMVSLDAAARALADGYAVLIYPEGTTTKSPQMWPMTAKSGAARLALRTGATVIPIAHWGAQRIIPPSSGRVHLRSTTSQVRAGAPVALDDLADRAGERSAWEEGTARMMSAITAILAQLRGQRPPAEPFDRRLPRPPDR